MNPWDQLIEIIKRGLVEVGLMSKDGKPVANIARVISSQQLFGKVREALRELNMGARYIGEDGYVYIDWDKYLSDIDVYYDDDGSLFLLCTRQGKLYRLPINVNGDEISLGEPIEIPLTGRAVQSRFTVVRDTQGNLRWYAIAASSVLNRVGEIDSRELFDSFIAHVQRTGEYPILSFYHMPDQIRFGVADFLAREDNLYLASGVFDENEVARAAAAGLEKSEDEWGTSIGFFVTCEPTLLRVNGVNIPVYTQGINSEISIVLEREAAAHFTSIGTREVERSMRKDVYDRLVALVGKERADLLAAQADETNRAIDLAGMVTREGSAADATAQPVVAAAGAAPSIQAATADAPATQPTATQERDAAAPQEFEIPEEFFNGLVEALLASPSFAGITSGIAQANASLAALAPRVESLEQSQRTAQTRIEERLAALELDDETRHAEWVADLPQQPRVITLRPREARAVELNSDGTPAEPASVGIANNTLAGMKSKSNRTNGNGAPK